MKTKFIVPAFAFMALLWTSCTEETDNLLQDAEIPVLDIEVNAQAEALSDQIDDIAAAVVVGESSSAKGSAQQRVMLPECVTITENLVGNKMNKTLDFGDGCPMANGVVYSGQLFVSYIWDAEMRRADIVVETENLGVNDLLIAGRKAIVRTWPAAGSEDFPMSEVNTELTVSHPSGLNAVVSGVTTREWIEGFGSDSWGDNVVLIGGSRRVTSFLNDAELGTYVMEITDKLRREWACRFIVSGELVISRGDFTATMNFGEGLCDNKAMLTTSGGRSKEIELR